MSKGFSLSFSVIQRIHEHHVHPAENRAARFCQQELIDRVLVLSLSILAAVDIGFHVALFTLKTSRGIYKAILYGEPLSFDEAMRHLRIAWLFRSVLVFGSWAYLVKPSSISGIFESSLTDFTRALLLSGSPEICKDPCHTGGLCSLALFHHFCNLVEYLPEKIQLSMQHSLFLVREWQNFSEKCLPSYLDILAIDLTLNFFYEEVDNIFKKLRSVENDPFTKTLFKKILSRIVIVTLAPVSAFMAVVGIGLMIHNLLMLSLLKIKSLFSNQDFNIQLLKTKPRIRALQLNATSIFLCLTAIPYCLTYGIYDPFKIQSLFYSSPLAAASLQIHQQQSLALDELSQKIANLSPGASLLILISIPMRDPSIADGHHGYYLLITKAGENYILSLINRGDNRHSIARVDGKNDVDYSLSNVPLYPAVVLTRTLFATQYRKITHSWYKSNNGTTLLDLAYSLLSPDLLKEDIKKDSRLKELYQSCNCTRFESNHSRRVQRIGNCGLSNLLGAISLHKSMEGRDILKEEKKLQDKRVYKQFIYALKQLVFRKYSHLLDFDLTLHRDKELPSAVVWRNLEKARKKLVPCQ